MEGQVRARYVARSREIAARRLGDEVVVMSARDSTLFSLNEVAGLIWEAADGVTPLADIVERAVCSAYDVDGAQALADAEELVDRLAGHGILRVSGEPITRDEV